MKSHNNAISRSSVNETQYQQTALPKSGFNLSISNLWHGILGRLHIGDFDYTMPGDKIMFGHSHQVTFDRIATPVISPMEFRQYNFYVCFRALIDTWRDFQSPSKRNKFDTGTLPTFTLRQLFYPAASLFQIFCNTGYSGSSQSTPGMVAWANGSYTSDPSHWTAAWSALSTMISQGAYKLDSFYAGGSLRDLIAQLRSIVPTAVPTDSASLGVVLDNVFLAIVDFICGEGSLLDSLNLLYFRHYDLAGFKQVISGQYQDDLDTWCLFVSDVPMNDLSLRAYTAIWVEYFRNVDLEPMVKELDYKKWSAAPFFYDDMSWLSFCDLVPLWITRPCKWDPDLFTGAQIDDISRHVFAPISSELYVTGSRIAVDPDSEGLLPNIDSVTIPFSDGIFGRSASSLLSLSLPTFGSYLLNGWKRDDVKTYALDLHNLRLAQAVQRYLKRIYDGGDEYRDNLASLYDVDLSDDKLNRPILISGDISKVDPRQEVSSVGTDATPVGSRTATATATSSGDGASYFAEEFGLVFNICAVVPRAQYDGLDPRSTMVKISDFPNPLFAESNEEISSKLEICRSAHTGSNLLSPFGYHPYAHSWRGRNNQVHGRFHSSMIDCTFLRFFDGENASVSTPVLNYQFISCHPVPRPFVDQTLLDGQFYVQSENQLLVERTLPVPVEQI